MASEINETYILDDSEVEVEAESHFSPQCLLCQHLDENGRSCKAFARIPDDIWTGETIHDEPIEGDGGYRFTSIKWEQ